MKVRQLTQLLLWWRKSFYNDYVFSWPVLPADYRDIPEGRLTPADRTTVADYVTPSRLTGWRTVPLRWLRLMTGWLTATGGQPGGWRRRSVVAAHSGCRKELRPDGIWYWLVAAGYHCVHSDRYRYRDSREGLPLPTMHYSGGGLHCSIVLQWRIFCGELVYSCCWVMICSMAKKKAEASELRRPSY